MNKITQSTILQGNDVLIDILHKRIVSLAFRATLKRKKYEKRYIPIAQQLAIKLIAKETLDWMVQTNNRALSTEEKGMIKSQIHFLTSPMVGRIYSPKEQKWINGIVEHIIKDSVELLRGYFSGDSILQAII